MSASVRSLAPAYQQAMELTRQGQLERAESICREILRAQSDHADALLLLGVIELQSGRPAQAAASFVRSLEIMPSQGIASALLGDALTDMARPAEALDAYERALRSSPDLTPAHFGRGNVLLDLRRPREALAAYAEVLRLQPDHPEALFNRGNAWLSLAECEAAIGSFDAAIHFNPGYAVAYNNRGSALMSLRRAEQALESFDKAVAIDPKLASAWHNRGCTLRELRRPLEALEAFDRALQLQGDYADAFCGRGDTLLDLDRTEEALAAHDRAVALALGSTNAHNGRGSSLRALRRLPDAIASYDEALRLDPANPAAHYNRGNALLDSGRREEALAGFEWALRLKPGFLQALRSRGEVLLAQQRFEAAVRCYQDLLRVDPAAEYATGALLHAQQCCADWSVNVAAAGRDRVHEAVRAGTRADLPFSFLAVADSPAAQLRCAQTFASHRCPPLKPLYAGTRYRHDRIRVAYVSADFRDHAVSRLLADVFERHDRRRFETFAISLRPEEQSALGQRVKGAFDRFIDVSGQSDREVAELIHALEIDIAVDLVGFTDGLRPQIFSRRPAPVQVNYLGFPGTMGAPYMDYILADTFVIPPAQSRHFSESVVYLPNCFQANDSQRKIGARTTRLEAGLPDDAFVFCCFNNSYKFNPAMFDIWMRLLDGVPGSVLWLLSAGNEVDRNLRREAVNRGIDPAGLLFASRRPYEEHLSRLRLADLFLDTLPFNAGATASDALWAGLPVLTCAGEAFAARMAGSLLQAVGLTELITHNLADYETKALELARQPSMLLGLRETLNRTGRAAPVFDSNHCRLALESAYQEMWRRHENGQGRESFAVHADT
jgi:predicted O-linked N-acetylglucosamine transferase (SPINDLY family)